MGKIKSMLKNEKGEAYIGVVIFLMVASVMIIFMVQMGSVAIKKLALDDDAKAIVKAVQVEGGITETSQKVIDEVKAKYSVDSNGDGDYNDAGDVLADISITGEGMVLKDGTDDVYIIQLGNAFEVNVSCGYRIGIGKASVVIPLQSKQVGVSEMFWKELEE